MSTTAFSFEASPGKSLFRIGEVSRITDTKPFVLRYWETEFPMLQPVKSPKGHRLYRREDVATVLQIKKLLYEEGFTIAGARRHLNEAGGRERGVSADLPANAELETSDSLEEGDGDEGSETQEREDLFSPIAAPKPVTERPAPPMRFESAAGVNREALKELRDELRAFLTLLESQ